MLSDADLTNGYLAVWKTWIKCYFIWKYRRWNAEYCNTVGIFWNFISKYLHFSLQTDRRPSTANNKNEGGKKNSNTHNLMFIRLYLYSYLDTLAFKSQKFKFPSTSPRTRISPFQAMHVMLPMLPWKYLRSRIKSCD